MFAFLTPTLESVGLIFGGQITLFNSYQHKYNRMTLKTHFELVKQMVQPLIWPYN